MVDVDVVRRDPDALRSMLTPTTRKGHGHRENYICPNCGDNAVEVFCSKHTGAWMFKCWGCNEAGDVVRIFEIQHKVSRRDAFKLVRDEWSKHGGHEWIPPKSSGSAAGPAARLSPKAAEVLEAEVKRWRSRCSEYCRQRVQGLTPESAGGQYLTGRGFDLTLMRRYGVGFDARCNAFNQRIKYGMPAVILPYDREGSYFTARVLKPKKDGAKYLQPPSGRTPKGWEPPIFHGAQLYLDGAEAVFITEGELDALSISQIAYHNQVKVGAVATGGASNYRKLVDLLSDRRPSARIVIAFDADRAGRANALRLAEMLDGIGLPYSIVSDWDGEKDAGALLERSETDLRDHVLNVVGGDARYFVQLEDLRMVVEAEAEDHAGGVDGDSNME